MNYMYAEAVSVKKIHIIERKSAYYMYITIFGILRRKKKCIEYCQKRPIICIRATSRNDTAFRVWSVQLKHSKLLVFSGDFVIE